MTQVDLAHAARISDDWVSHIECGRRLPSAPVLARLAQALGVSTDRLLGLE